MLATGRLGGSTMPATGSYSREQSFPLYTVDTAGRAAEVDYGAAGEAAEVQWQYGASVRW